MLKNITDEVLSTIGSWMMRLVSGLLNAVIGFFDLDNFRPTPSYFNERIINGSENVDNIYSTFQNTAFVILVILFAWNVGVSVINRTYKDKDVKDNLRTMFIRSIICIILISSSKFLCTNVISVTVDFFYDGVIVPLVGEGIEGDSGVLKAANSDGTTSMLESIGASNVDNYMSSSVTMDVNGQWVLNDNIGTGTVITSEEQAATDGGLLIGFLASIVEVYFLGSILYNYMKLIIELARRYAKWCFMYITYPLACSTYVSTATENIFLNYLGGFTNEGVAIILSVFIIRMTNWFMQVSSGNFLAIFFIIGWINIGVSIEQFMREHGFVIGSSGGSLLDNMLQAAHNMSHIGSKTRNMAAKGLIGAAAISNNVPLAKVGTALGGMGIGDAAAMAAMRSSLGGAIGRAMNGGNEHLGVGQQEAMDRMFRRSGDFAEKGAFLSSYNMLGAEDQAAYANHLLNDVIGSDNIRNAMGLSNDAALTFSDVTMDQKGNLVGTATTDMGSSNFVFSTNATANSIGLTGTNGDAMHMAFSNGSLAEMADGIVLNDIMSEDAFNSNDISGNPISSLGGFTADDIHSVMDAHGNDEDLSHYTFSNEGGIPHIDYNRDGSSFNGVMKAQDGTTFRAANMCQEFNGAYTLTDGIDSTTRWDAKDENKNFIIPENDIRRTLRVNDNAPAGFAGFGIKEIRSVEYINGKDSSNGYVLNCNMRNGEKQTFDYTPASNHVSAVKRGASVIRGGVVSPHRDKQETKPTAPQDV